MWRNVKWIGVPRSEIAKWNILEGDMTGRFAYFRQEFDLEEEARLRVRLTAISRYRLWVNGEPALSGPCKGDEHRLYYDEVDLTSCLRKGKNVLAVSVLYQDPDAVEGQYEERAAIFGVRSIRGGHRLALEGEAVGSRGDVLARVSTGEGDWRVWLDGSFYLKSNEVTANLGAVCEEIDLRKVPAGWKNGLEAGTALESGGAVLEADGSLGHRETVWPRAAVLGDVLQDPFFSLAGILPKYPLLPREIPLMEEAEDGFVREFTRTGLLERGTLTVASEEEVEILLDAGVHKNGYLRFPLEGGRGRKVRFTYGERFELLEREGLPLSEEKKRRFRKSDWKDGVLKGLTDTVTVSGEKVRYEPFWYRTFRFLRIRVEAGEEALTLSAPSFRRTGYPLKVESSMHSSAEWVDRVWEICVRTLRNCMMETYMDCPYYEQMQFPMDTRLQALFNYAVSSDPSLARKALKDYHYAMLPVGLIPGKYPSAYCQVISTFSLHYIFMLEEYYEQTGDVKPLLECRGDVDRILSYYEGKMGEDGLLGRLGYWEFVDWQKAWKDSAGMPAALEKSPSTIINFMYAYALKCGARIQEVTGRPALAEEYLDRRRRLLEKVQGLCWDEGVGMYREGPQFPQFSQHAQSWAVLNEMLSPGERKMLMERASRGDGQLDTEEAAGSGTPDDKGGCVPILQVSFSTAYEYFRAMEEAGIYEKTEENLMRWAGLLDLDCTTCPEEPEGARSECHAWSALPIYEMVRCLAGIRGKEGWREVLVAPHLEFLPDLSGTVATPKGPIVFSYGKEDGEGTMKYHYELILPKGLGGTFRYPDGRVEELRPGENRLDYFQDK